MTTMTPDDLSARLTTWAQPNATTLSAQDRQTLTDFQQRFPLQTLTDLPLDQYVVGRGDNSTFCYALEWGTSELGSIRGGSAAKFGVYWSQAKADYVVNAMFTSPEQARETILNAIVQAARKLEEGDLGGADQASAQMGEARYGLRLKPLFLYFPERLLPITQPRHLQHFLRALGQVPSGDQAALNHQLLTFLQAQPGADAYDTVGLMRFLYDQFPPQEAAPVQAQRRVWKVSLGEGAQYLPEALNLGVAFIGSRLENLSAVPAGEMADQLNDVGDERTFASSAVAFAQEMQEGDVVIANRGLKTVAAVGLVEGPYLAPGDAFNPLTAAVLGDRFPFWAHARRVRWLLMGDQPLPPEVTRFARRTVTPAPEATLQRMLSAYAGPHPSPDVTLHLAELGWTGGAKPPPVDPGVQYLMDLASHTRNIVLYGPPGTGKTYAARQFAQAWLGRSSPSAPAAPLPPRRLWWQAIALALADLKDATVAQIVTHPEVEELAATRPGNASVTSTVWQQLLTHTHPEDQSSNTTSRHQPSVFTRSGTDQATSVWTLNDEGRKVAAQLQATVPTAPALPDTSLPNLHLITFHPAFSYEEFIEGLRPTASGGFEVRDGAFKRVCLAAHANPDQAYVVIIDEINRADTAKTFGELITLIEDDKRAEPGTPGLYRVTLPYSEAPDNLFSVPSNVYVIGTMNTADRSITLMDVALRRRFTFVEVAPRPELLTGTVAGTALSPERLLRTLNAHLTQALDADHRVGHAYLMGEALTVRDIAFRWRHKLIPLLQEYFYGQDPELRTLLGDALYLDATGVNRLTDDALASALATFANAAAAS